MRIRPASSGCAVLLVMTAALGGCSIQRLVLNQTAPLIKNVLPAFETEGDYDLAASAMPGSIKIVEGFLLSGPDNQELLLVASQAYAAYALLFLEEALDRETPESDRVEGLRIRVRESYLRAHRHALRWLDERHEGIAAALEKGGERAKALEGCEQEDVPGLFWAGMSLASAINVSRDDVSLIMQLPKAKALLQRVIELDERYYYGGAHLVMGTMLGSMPPDLGGEPANARKHLSRALELSQKKFLMVQVFWAKSLAVQTQDRRSFEQLLGDVLQASLEVEPAQKLANVAAKRRARVLLSMTNQLF